MTDCVYTGRTTPRILPRRHEDGCNNETCTGCLPCPSAHCIVCDREHATGTCAGCLHDVRETLADIRRMCRDLPAEVEVKGVDSEAMNLLGPATDPEQWGHREASARAGRIDSTYLEVATDLTHPLGVLWEWVDKYAEAREDPTQKRMTVESAAAYLDRILSWAAGFEHVPFDDMTRDLRKAAAHLEDVLRDGERDIITANVVCLTCATPLRRRMTDAGIEDKWWCRRCRQHLTQEEYNLAYAQAASDELLEGLT